MSTHNVLTQIERAVATGDAIDLIAGSTLTVKNSSGSTLFSIVESTGAVTAASGDEIYAVLPLIGGPNVDQWFFRANRAMTITKVNWRFSGASISSTPTMTIYSGPSAGTLPPVSTTPATTGLAVSATPNTIQTATIVSSAVVTGGWLGIGLGGGVLTGNNGILVVTLNPA